MTGEAPNLVLLERAATTHGTHARNRQGYSHGTTSFSSRHLYPYLHCVVEGGWVIDKWHLQDHPKFVGWVCNDPMPSDVDAPDKCPVPSGVMLAGLQGAFQVLAARRVADTTYSGLDFIPVADYVALWAARGAKVGRRIGTEVHWMDGSKTTICEDERTAYLVHHEMDAML